MKNKDYYKVSIPEGYNFVDYAKAYEELVQYLFDKGRYVSREELTHIVKDIANSYGFEIEIEKQEKSSLSRSRYYA